MENPKIPVHLGGLGGEADTESTPRPRAAVLLSVKRLHAAKVQLIALLTG